MGIPTKDQNGSKETPNNIGKIEFSFDDSPVHQLLLCLEVQDTSYLQLKEELGGADPHSYLDEVLTKSSTQKAFIRRVEFLWGQNDALQDLSN